MTELHPMTQKKKESQGFEKIICPGCQADISDQKPTKILSSSFKKPEEKERTESKNEVEFSLNFSPEEKDPQARIPENKTETKKTERGAKTKKAIDRQLKKVTKSLE